MVQGNQKRDYVHELVGKHLAHFLWEQLPHPASAGELFAVKWEEKQD